MQPEGGTGRCPGRARARQAAAPARSSRSLEEYAGKTVDLYLVAAAADDTGYADSPNGIVYTMTVPDAPDCAARQVGVQLAWEMPRPTRFAASDFRNGGLTGHRHAAGRGEHAAGRQHLPAAGGESTGDKRHRELGTYPVSAMRESGGSYVCSAVRSGHEIRGPFSIRFETRISQSAGQVSSAWVEGDTVTLPRVRLDTPAASLANVNETVRVTYGQANLMIYQGGVDRPSRPRSRGARWKTPTGTRSR